MEALDGINSMPFVTSFSSRWLFGLVVSSPASFKTHPLTKQQKNQQQLHKILSGGQFLTYSLGTLIGTM